MRAVLAEVSAPPLSGEFPQRSIGSTGSLLASLLRVKLNECFSLETSEIKLPSSAWRQLSDIYITQRQ